MEGRLTGGGGGGGRGAGLEEAEGGANRTAAGEGMDALGVSGSLPPEVLSCFQFSKNEQKRVKTIPLSVTKTLRSNKKPNFLFAFFAFSK